MKISMRILTVLTVLTLLTGCLWFQDNRPEPQGPPYASDAGQPRTACTEAEAVNAAVSSISLRMAASSARGPFRVVPAEKKTTALGYRIMDSLVRMRLSRFSGANVLRLEDWRGEKGEWSFILRSADGEIWLTRTFLLKGVSDG